MTRMPLVVLLALSDLQISIPLIPGNIKSNNTISGTNELTLTPASNPEAAVSNNSSLPLNSSTRKLLSCVSSSTINNFNLLFILLGAGSGSTVSNLIPRERANLSKAAN